MLCCHNLLVCSTEQWMGSIEQWVGANSHKRVFLLFSILPQRNCSRMLRTPQDSMICGAGGGNNTHQQIPLFVLGEVLSAHTGLLTDKTLAMKKALVYMQACLTLCKLLKLLQISVWTPIIDVMWFIVLCTNIDQNSAKFSDTNIQYI